MDSTLKQLLEAFINNEITLQAVLAELKDTKVKLKEEQAHCTELEKKLEPQTGEGSSK